MFRYNLSFSFSVFICVGVVACVSHNESSCAACVISANGKFRPMLTRKPIKGGSCSRVVIKGEVIGPDQLKMKSNLCSFASSLPFQFFGSKWKIKIIEKAKGKVVEEVKAKVVKVGAKVLERLKVKVLKVLKVKLVEVEVANIVKVKVTF